MFVFCYFRSILHVCQLWYISCRRLCFGTHFHGKCARYVQSIIIPGFCAITPPIEVLSGHQLQTHHKGCYSSGQKSHMYILQVIFLVCMHFEQDYECDRFWPARTSHARVLFAWSHLSPALALQNNYLYSQYVSLFTRVNKRKTIMLNSLVLTPLYCL